MIVADYLVGEVAPAVIKFINDTKRYDIETKRTKHTIKVTTNLDIEDKSFEISLNYKVKLK